MRVLPRILVKMCPIFLKCQRDALTKPEWCNCNQPVHLFTYRVRHQWVQGRKRKGLALLIELRYSCKYSLSIYN